MEWGCLETETAAQKEGGRANLTRLYSKNFIDGSVMLRHGLVCMPSGSLLQL